MTDPSNKNETTPDPWGSFEPYVQLVRSLLPRATSVSLFDAAGAMRWSSETTTGPGFLQSRRETRSKPAGRSPQGPGQLRMLDGSQPVYLFWIRDDAEQLIGIVAVVCRQPAATRTPRAAASRSPTRCCVRCSSACAVTCCPGRLSIN